MTRIHRHKPFEQVSFGTVKSEDLLIYKYQKRNTGSDTSRSKLASADNLTLVPAFDLTVRILLIISPSRTATGA
ncbi:MAG: hypothetical protein M2R45_03663 [Verrucomicrobia subdivision 3 bacterium]|nr:hypothetical protein [Limisphaerales bacterium]MCS1412708.1 hypothetical protein [Limisphaerales bacterium]